MILDNELYSNIDFLFKHYNKVVLNKFDNNYVIYFGDPKNTPSDSNITQLENNLKSVFESDLKNMLLYAKIKNIPSVLNNPNIYKKLESDLIYFDNVKSNIFNYFYTNQSNTKQIHQQQTNYEEIIKQDLKSDNYLVRYNITETTDKNISIRSYQKALNKLSSYNDYLNSISDETKYYSNNL